MVDLRIPRLNHFGRRRRLIAAVIGVLRLFPKRIREILLFPFFQADSMLGVAARYIYYKSICPDWGDNIYIASKVVFKYIDRIHIGNNVSIHEFCYLDGYGGIEIGSDISIAHSSSILSSEHDWSGEEPIKYNPSLPRSVRISGDTWVGCGVRILGGTQLGPRTVVAAGAIVKGTHNGREILAGVPAKLVRRLD